MSEPVDHSTAAVVAGLDDARGTLAEIWRRSNDDEHRALCMRALRGVIAAEQTMRAADAFLLAGTKADRLSTFEALRLSCVLRVGWAVRSKP